MKKALVLGGAGFLGYHTAMELASRNYDVQVVSLPPLLDRDMFPDNIRVELTDFFALSDSEILSRLNNVYAVFYATGVDERVIPPIPAAKFFYEKNVLPTQRLTRLCNCAGVQKFILYGSYTAHFAELWPDLNYRTINGYPRTRLLQEELAYLEGIEGMDVITLRLPYIFGTMRGVTPLWSMFVEPIKGQSSFYAPMGGTAMITVQQVAQAAVGAMERGKHETSYALGGINMKYARFYEIIVEQLGQSTQIVPLPLEKMIRQMKQIDAETAAQGLEHGIHMEYTAIFQDRDSYIDPAPVMQELGYKPMDVEASIRETITKCVADDK